MSPDSRPIHPADRLLAAIEEKRAPVCVGIDPILERLPAAVCSTENDPGSPTPIGAFVLELLQAIQSHVPCVKFQSACYERFGFEGLLQLHSHIREATRLGLEVALDAKRGDIGISAEHYAEAAFDVTSPPLFKVRTDWLTINSYLGPDGITPFLQHEGHGAFALVRTSNPGGDEIQNLQLKDGRTVAHAVAEMIARIGGDHVGERGYSSLGAVVGATKKQDAAALRQIMPQQIFLVPGYGAQGGGVDDILPCFKPGGAGAIISASRSVIYAFDPKDPKWMNSVADAAAKFADDVGRAVGIR